MRRLAACAIALCAGSAGSVLGAGNSVVVTNPTPAVTATSQLLGFNGQCYTTSISGKVKPAYRGHGASVRLVCNQYPNIRIAMKVFGGQQACGDAFCEGEGANVDACGNFNISFCDDTPQLDPSWVCHFVVHVDDSKSPQACGQKPAPIDDAPVDPNGSAPCSGGYCPASP